MNYKSKRQILYLTKVQIHKKTGKMRRLEKYENILTKCVEQSNLFEKWDKQRSWSKFHHSHYDWWAFPIDKPSRGHGDEYKVGEKEKQMLSKDEKFLNALRNNAIFVCRSWGWNLEKNEQYKPVDKDQVWQNWSIRLSKMCRSLQIFQQQKLFKNSILYGVKLLETQKKFQFGREDLTPYFWKHYQLIMKEQIKDKVDDNEKVDSSEKKVNSSKIMENNETQVNIQPQNSSNKQNMMQKVQISEELGRTSFENGSNPLKIKLNDHELNQKNKKDYSTIKSTTNKNGEQIGQEGEQKWFCCCFPWL